MPFKDAAKAKQYFREYMRKRRHREQIVKSDLAQQILNILITSKEYGMMTPEAQGKAKEQLFEALQNLIEDLEQSVRKMLDDKLVKLSNDLMDMIGSKITEAAQLKKLVNSEKLILTAVKEAVTKV